MMLFLQKIHHPLEVAQQHFRLLDPVPDHLGMFPEDVHLPAGLEEVGLALVHNWRDIINILRTIALALKRIENCPSPATNISSKSVSEGFVQQNTKRWAKRKITTVRIFFHKHFLVMSIFPSDMEMAMRDKNGQYFV